MSSPTVVAIMLANGRPEMVKRAVASFRAQTYQEKRLLIWDTTPGCGSQFIDAHVSGDVDVPDVNKVAFAGASIGALRNCANGWTEGESEIICHWDSDDYSHPNRIAEQVALLQASGKEAVGYREMPFWRQGSLVDVTTDQNAPEFIHAAGEAWLYSNNSPYYCLGTSLMYWRESWEDHPFADAPKRKGAIGEDTLFLREVKSRSVSTLVPVDRSLGPNMGYGPDPRMIASIHGSNTQDYNYVVGNSDNWRRVPEWDAYCERTMQL